jgi:hypothetical protein
LRPGRDDLDLLTISVNLKGMPGRSRRTDECIAGLELRLTDLRAHFEAQLRTVKRAELCLQRCGGSGEAAAFEAAADGFRDQLMMVAENRKTIGTLLDQIVSEGGKLTFASRPRKS